jgi:hypothetical protein
MKQNLAASLAVAICAAIWPMAAAAGCLRGWNAVSSEEIVSDALALGFAPTAPLVRRGPYDVLYALNPQGMPVRIVADAELGDIWVNAVFTPRYNAGPRIIRVRSVDAVRWRVRYEHDGLPIRIIHRDPK